MDLSVCDSNGKLKSLMRLCHLLSFSGRNTPSPIKRALRQEANFGCAICGCPILDYHHIIPYHVSHAFLPEDMIVLCPTHHRRANDGEYSDKYLREMKKAPFNKTTVQDSFFLESGEMAINVATNTFLRTSRILEVDDFDLISLNMESRTPLFNLNIFDKANNWIGVVNENDWVVNRTLVWDVEYRPRHLVIRNAPRQVSLDARIRDSTIFLTGRTYFNGVSIEMTESGLLLGGEAAGTKMTDCVFSDVKVGISLHTRKNVHFKYR